MRAVTRRALALVAILVLAVLVVGAVDARADRRMAAATHAAELDEGPYGDPGERSVHLAAGVWIVRAQLALAFVWEVAANVRSAGRRPAAASMRVPRPAPMVNRRVRLGIGRLVAVLFAANLSVGAPSNAALVRSAAAVELPVTPRSYAPIRALANDVRSTSAPEWCVATDDSMWDVGTSPSEQSAMARDQARSCTSTRISVTPVLCEHVKTSDCPGRRRCPMTASPSPDFRPMRPTAFCRRPRSSSNEATTSGTSARTDWNSLSVVSRRIETCSAIATK